MDKNLFEQAKNNVLKHREKELKEEIREEHKRLIHESEKLDVTDEKSKEITALKKKIGSFPCRRMWEDHMLGRKYAQLEEMLETGKYHSTELEELKQFAIAREQEEKNRKNGIVPVKSCFGNLF